MASNSTGKWVGCAATTGGGRTYRGQMPVNWYATLAIICIVGLSLVGLSRYQRTHQASSSTGPPTINQVWHATLGKFVSGYKGLELTASTLQYPGKTAYTNGDVCPKGTPDAGKPGVVIVDSWNNFRSNGKGTQPSGPPQDLLFDNGQLITMAFVPATASVPKPPAQAITGLITSLQSGTAATTTTTPGATAASTPAATTTTTGSTTSTTTKNSGGTSK